MKREAEEHEKEDSAKKDIIETKNNAENLVYQTEKQLEENKDKISKEDGAEVKSKLDALKKSKDTDDIDKIKQLVEELNNAWSKISQQMYQQSQQGGEENPQDANQDANQEENEVLPKIYYVEIDKYIRHHCFS